MSHLTAILTAAIVHSSYVLGARTARIANAQQLATTVEESVAVATAPTVGTSDTNSVDTPVEEPPVLRGWTNNIGEDFVVVGGNVPRESIE